jgi:hypothetical protein
MELIVVERSFPEPVEFAPLQAAEDAVAWCLEQHDVHFLRSYFSRDRHHMVCLYEAPDAESVRTTQRQGKLPFDRIWTAACIEQPVREAAPPDFETVIVQRELPQPMTTADVDGIVRQSASCLDIHRAFLRRSYLAAGGDLMICCFEAPDAESVRISNREAGVPLVRAWTSTVHEP